MDNPYIIGSPVKDPGNFYGRKDEVREIISNIKKCLSTSLIGERGIGRTSLLRYISHPNVVSTYSNSGDCVVLYLGFGGFTQSLKEQFWNSVFIEIEKRVSKSGRLKNLSKKGNLSTLDIYEFFGELHDNNVEIVFCCDEFDAVTRNPHFDLDFFDSLRHLSQTYDVTFITASKKNLKELTFSGEQTTSPFFNIFYNMRIGFYKKEEAEELILTPSKIAGIKFNNEDVDFVFDVAHYHPFFIQAACYEVFEHRLTEQKIKGEMLEPTIYTRLKNMLYKKVKDHLDYYWNPLEEDEKKKLKELCKSPKNSTEEDSITEILKDICLIKDENGKYKLFSSLFQKFCSEAKLSWEPFG